MQAVPTSPLMGLGNQGTSASVSEVLAQGGDISIIDLVNALIKEAHIMRASDIHIDPARDRLRVRLRIDGVLQETTPLPKTISSEVISRIKVLAGMRTDEHQKTQDGRFRHTFPTSTDSTGSSQADSMQASELLDVRVSIAPTYHGENVVLRLLMGGGTEYTLEMLGFSEHDQAKIRTAIRKPHGMILVTGPTGSGKTTTLYTLLKMLNSPDVSIVTIEDPIEYAIENIEQIQINPAAGLTFGSGLRSILRQDPNIIMVGEIRDTETASIAVNTALTGHLLLSTLHTNDAATTLPRLLDMGVDPYLVSSTISIAIGQRLVRKICTACREEVSATLSVVETLGDLPLRSPVAKGEKFYRAAGCEACNGIGFMGRVCISEVLVADGAIRDAIQGKSSANVLKKIAVTGGMVPMLEDGFAKARAGITTVEEVLRTVYE